MLGIRIAMARLRALFRRPVTGEGDEKRLRSIRADWPAVRASVEGVRREVLLNDWTNTAASGPR